MATKLDLLLDFENGQGVSGGASNYTNYGIDFDTNFTSVQSTVNQMIDELNVARLGDAIIPADMLRSDDVSNGRYSAEDAAVSRPTSTTVTIASGPIYVNGQKVTVVGQTFNFTGLGVDETYFINTDVNGLLNLNNNSGQAFFDIASVDWDGATLIDANVVDLLYAGGEVLRNIKSGYLQEPGNPPGAITEVFDVDYPARLKPHLRYKTREGVLGAAGIFAGVDNAFGWTSGLDGSNDTVLAGTYGATGQVSLLEQARFVGEGGSPDQSIPVSASFTALIFNAPAALNAPTLSSRREPASYLASTDWLNGSGSVITVPASAAFTGFYQVNAYAVLDSPAVPVAFEFIDMLIQLTTGGGKQIARVRVPFSDDLNILACSGHMDLASGDTIELQMFHSHTAALDMAFCRMSLMMVGGGP